jgi:hypothetical protein
VGDRGVGGGGGGFVGKLVGWCVGGTSERRVEYISERGKGLCFEVEEELTGGKDQTRGWVL